MKISNIAVELFNQAVKDGIWYSSYMGDGDTTTDSCLNTHLLWDREV